MKRNLIAIIAATLVILAGVIGGVTVLLRREIQLQLLNREAAIIHAVAQHEAMFDGQPLIDMVLNMVAMQGVVGIRTFTPSGHLINTLPENLTGQDLNGKTPTGRQPQVEFHPSVLLDTLYADPFGELSLEPVPLLIILVPLFGPEGAPVRGFAEFLLDGTDTMGALRSLDRNLLGQAMAAFLVGGLLCTLILVGSFRQLEKKNRDLAQANQELTLQAKTAAIGAISSHLFHGIKNSISGLNHAFEGEGTEGDNSRDEARRSANDLHQMVQEIINVIQEEALGISYRLSSREILDLAVQKVQSQADLAGVSLQVQADKDFTYRNRDSHLLLLTLENLLRNAIEASEPGQSVSCRFVAGKQGEGIFWVTDSGPGIPDADRARLFEPGRSGKANGTGLGLAISRQLCRQFGGELSLVDSNSSGSQFQVVTPPPLKTP